KRLELQLPEGVFGMREERWGWRGVWALPPPLVGGYHPYAPRLHAVDELRHVIVIDEPRHGVEVLTVAGGGLGQGRVEVLSLLARLHDLQHEIRADDGERRPPQVEIGPALRAIDMGRQQRLIPPFRVIEVVDDLHEMKEFTDGHRPSLTRCTAR